MNNCNICYEKNINLIQIKCSHCICFNCFFKLQSSQCPYCRTEFDNQLKSLSKLVSMNIDLYKKVIFYH